MDTAHSTLGGDAINDPFLTRDDGAYPTSRPVRIILAAYLITLNIFALAALFVAWPGMDKVFLKVPSVPNEIRYLLMSLIGGMIGTSLVLLTSFTTYVGNRRLRASWTMWYVLRPFIGMTTGLLVYAAIRGGILKVSSDVDALNPFAVTAISVLSGLYSNQLLYKLQQLAEKQFQTTAEASRRDKIVDTDSQKSKDSL